MFEDAKVVVVTSKFLQLSTKLNQAIKDNEGYDNSVYATNGTSEVTRNIRELQKAFNELCILLHELATKEDNT